MNYDIVESFSQMVRDKGIDRDRLVTVIEDIFGMMVKKKYGLTARYEIVVNMDKGDIEIFLLREVADEITDPVTQISVEEARQRSGEELEVGEEYVEIINLAEFGRRLIVTAKQNLNQKIKEIEKDLIYDEYIEKKGDIIVGDIYQVRRNDVLINHNRSELVLPKSEQIGKERYRKGDTIRCVVKDVVRKGSGMPTVIVSRADPLFLRKLFEMEIPEVYDGVITIRKIAREPGERAKVAVESHDDRIDAVGACVGMKGARIHAIVRELNNENIDIINYTEDPYLFIQRALAPAKLLDVKLNREARIAEVHVNADQASLAIGKNGQNIRLASQLTAFKIEIVKEGGEEPKYDFDLELSDFVDDFGEELIAEFAKAGYVRAGEVLAAAPGDLLLKVPSLTPERLKAIIRQIKEAFAEAAEEEEEGETAEEEEEEETPEAAAVETEPSAAEQAVAGESAGTNGEEEGASDALPAGAAEEEADEEKASGE